MSLPFKDRIVQIYIPLWLYSNSRYVSALDDGITIYIPLWLYSNQCHCVCYSKRFNNLHSTLVIFKCTVIKQRQIKFNIYIPLWLYSNRNVYAWLIDKRIIYIPLWLYSNSDTSIQITLNSYIYIPLWLYSNDSRKIKK